MTCEKCDLDIIIDYTLADPHFHINSKYQTPTISQALK